jgi:hypothetical protein
MTTSRRLLLLRGFVRGTGLAAAGPLLMPFLAAADETPPVPTLSDILDRNAAARGGVQAWRRIDSMVWIGHVESSNGAGTGLPFRLDVMRPNKSHFELANANLKSLRVFDGKQGWKLRPSAAGKPEVLDYSPDERLYSRDEQVIDGFLIDHQAKGHIVTLESRDEVEGRPAYRLGVTLPSGAAARLWVDSQSFLETRLERRSASGAVVAILYREYRDFEGVKMPTVIETSRTAAGQFDRLVIDRVLMNPPLPVNDFAKPGTAARAGRVIVDTRAPASAAVPSSR